LNNVASVYQLAAKQKSPPIKVAVVKEELIYGKTLKDLSTCVSLIFRE